MRMQQKESVTCLYSVLLIERSLSGLRHLFVCIHQQLFGVHQKGGVVHV
jgi:hypothetical protein